MPSIQAICFDLFNTLVSVGEVPQEVGRYTADVLGLDAEIWNDACFGPAHEICAPTVHEEVMRVLAHSINPSISMTKIAEATRERQARFDYALRHVRAGTLATLAALRESGLKLALVSNASSGEVAAWQESPLAQYFDVTLFSCECGAMKPHPEIYRLALTGLEVRDPATCLYVGDGGSHELHGAHSLGMPTILTREFLSPQRYLKVTGRQAASIGREINAVGELRDLLTQVSV